MRHWKVARSRDFEPSGRFEYGRAFVVRRTDGSGYERQIDIEFVDGGDEDLAAARLKKFLHRPEAPPSRVVVDRAGAEVVLEP